MTSNQINYLTLQESKRHNLVSEDELNRHNVVTENETQRHNLATESVGLFTAETQRMQQEELQRANLVREEQNQQQINEVVRHNFGSENLQLRSLLETMRNNTAMNQIGFLNAAVAQQNADTNLLNAWESQRHNQEQEAINTFQSKETMRHNLKSEDLQTDYQNIQRFQSVSSAGANLTNAQTNVNQLNEHVRHNLITEAFARTNLKVNTAVEMLRMANSTANTVISSIPKLFTGGLK